MINSAHDPARYGCLFSVTDDIKINGASSSFSISQAKIIGKTATSSTMGNFLGLGRPVVESPYISTREIQFDYTYSYLLMNDYNE